MVDAKISKLMPELGFAPEDGDRLVASFSSGWQMRMSLGKILLQYNMQLAKAKIEETAPGVATGMILSLRESLQTYKDNLAKCQVEYDSAKSEVQKWHSAFQNEPFINPGTSPDPTLVINYLQTLKKSEESLKEQLEKAKKKEAAFIVKFAKREQEIAELKFQMKTHGSQLAIS